MYHNHSATHHASRVPDIWGVVGRIILQIVIDSGLLVRGHCEVVTETSTRVDNLHASHFRLNLGYSCIWLDHGSADRCDVGTGARETGIEDHTS